MNQLDSERHSAFRVLSKNVKEEDVRRFLEESLTLVNQGDRENADAVFEVSIAANSALYEKIRSDGSNVQGNGKFNARRDCSKRRRLTLESLLSIESSMKAAD